MITKENLEIWIETEEGKKAIESSLKEARELTEKFRKAQQISLESLTRVYNR